MSFDFFSLFIPICVSLNGRQSNIFTAGGATGKYGFCVHELNNIRSEIQSTTIHFYQHLREIGFSPKHFVSVLFVCNIYNFNIYCT